MPEPSAGLLRLVRTIDRFTDSTGIWIAALSLPLVAAVTWEVVARYAFGAPTIWAFDVTYMLYGDAVHARCRPTRCTKAPTSAPTFSMSSWSVRTRGTIDAVAYIVFFFPALITFLVVSWNEAFYAWTINETSEQTPWRPILWPFKLVVPLACLLLLIQGISETIKSLWAARTGIVLEHKEKVEV